MYILSLNFIILSILLFKFYFHKFYYPIFLFFHILFNIFFSFFYSLSYIDIRYNLIGWVKYISVIVFLSYLFFTDKTKHPCCATWSIGYISVLFFLSFFLWGPPKCVSVYLTSKKCVSVNLMNLLSIYSSSISCIFF